MRPAKQRQNRKRVFACVGSLDLNKGVQCAARAFSAVPHARAELRVWGPAFEALTRFRDEPRFRHVKFCGAYAHHDIPRIYAGIDCLIVPSYFENHPTVILEAFSQGVPVIAARTGGIPELVADGVNGLLFEPGSVRDLAGKVTMLIDTPDLLERLRAHVPPVRPARLMGEELLARIRACRFSGPVRADIKLLAHTRRAIMRLGALKTFNYFAACGPAQAVKMRACRRGVRAASPASIRVFCLCSAAGKRERASALFAESRRLISTVDELLMWIAALRSAGDKKNSDKLLENVIHYSTMIERRYRLFLPELVYRVGSVCRHVGRLHEAAAAFDRVIASAASSTAQRSGAYFHKGEIARAQGDLRSAYAYFQKTLRYNPIHQKAHEWSLNLKEATRKKRSR